MAENKSPSRVTTVLAVIFLLQFFISGAIVFVNAFVPFLKEGVFAIIGLVLFAELFVLFVIGKSIQVLTWLRQSSTIALQEEKRRGTKPDPDFADDA